MQQNHLPLTKEWPVRLLDGRSVNREVHAPFCARLGVKFPRRLASSVRENRMHGLMRVGRRKPVLYSTRFRGRDWRIVGIVIPNAGLV